MTINLDIPIHFLDQQLDVETVEEVIEHFAVPMSDFGFTSISVKAQNEFGMYYHLADFLNEDFSVLAPIIPNTDPSPSKQGRKGIDLYSDVQPKGQLNDATVWLSAGHGWVYDKRWRNYKTQEPIIMVLLKIFQMLK